MHDDSEEDESDQEDDDSDDDDSDDDDGSDDDEASDEGDGAAEVGPGGLNLPQDPEELEAVAREQWIDRGFDEQEFTVEKMYEIWQNEEEEGMGRDIAGNNLKRKLDLIQARQDKRLVKISVKQIKESAKQKVKDIQNNATEKILDIRAGITPGFMLKRKRLKAFQEEVQQQIEEAQQKHARRLEVKAEKIANRLAAKEEAEARAIKVAEQEMFKEVERKSKAEAIARDRKEVSDRILARRNEENERLAQQNEEEGRQKKIQDAIDAKKRRDKYIRFMKTKKASFTEEAKSRFQRAKEEACRREAARAQSVKDEDADKQETDKADEAGEAIVSGGRPGIFSIPVGPTEYYSANDPNKPVCGSPKGPEDLGGLKPFSSQDTSTTIAQLDVKLMHAESAVVKKQQEIEALESKIEEYDSEVRTAGEHTEKLQKLILEIDDAKTKYERMLLGPPRREPNYDEMKYSLTLMSKKAEFLRTIGSEDDPKQDSLTYRRARAQSLRDESKEKLPGLKHEFEHLKSVAKKQRDKIDQHLKDQPELPVVIGRSLGKVEEFEGAVAATPGESLGKIVHQSHAELLKHAAKTIETHQRDLAKMAHSQWVLREEEHVLRGELELSKSRLADAEKRIYKAQEAGMRSDIVIALQKYFDAGGLDNLQKVEVIYKGQFDWWQGKLVEGCENVVNKPPSNRTCFPGVKLASGCEKGMIEGVLELPKYRLYRIKFCITCEVGSKFHYDESDFINIRIGPSIETLHLIGKYSNTFQARVTEHGRHICHNIDTLFVGNSFAYRFDFSCSSKTGNEMLIENGYFEMEVPPPIETKNGNQVLTDVVKMARIELYQGSSRTDRIVEELARAKNSTERHWDSFAVAGTPQRFLRTVFITLLEKELADEIEAKRRREAARELRKKALLNLGNDAPSKLVTGRRQKPATHAGEQHKSNQKKQLSKNTAASFKQIEKDEATERKVLLAKERYINRKRRGFNGVDIMVRAKELVGKKVEVFFEDICRWKLAQILDMKADWVEQDTRLRIQHKVRYSDQQGEESILWEEILLRRFVVLQHDLGDIEIRRREMEKLQKLKEQEKAEAEARIEKQEQDEYNALKVMEAQEKENVQKDAKAAIEALQKRVREETEYAFENNQALHDLIMRQLPTEEKVDYIDKEEEEYFRMQRKAERLEEYIAKAVALAEADAMEIWKHKLRCVRDKHAGLQQAFIKKKESRKQEAIQELKKQRALAKIEMTKQVEDLCATMRIVDIKLCTPRLLRCEHRRVRYWGTQYKSGVRCLNCNKELSRSYEDRYQAWDSNREMGEAVYFHRRDEARFLPDSEKHRARILDERLRVEKEEREIQLSERGLLEMDLSINMKKLSDRHLIRDNSTSMLMALHQPLNFFQTQRSVERQNYLEFFARLRNFNKKIETLKEKRVGLLRDRRETTILLELAHRDCGLLNKRVDNVESEYHRATEEMKTRQNIIECVDEYQKVLDEALDKRAKAELVYDSTLRKQFLLEANLDLNTELAADAMLQQKMIKKKGEEIEKNLAAVKGELDEAQRIYDKATLHLRKTRWQQQGIPVLYPPFVTKLGCARIQFCRPEDESKGQAEFIKLAIIFGCAKSYYKLLQNRNRLSKAEQLELHREIKANMMTGYMYVPLQRLIDWEVANQERECALMTQAEEETRKHIRDEKLVLSRRIEEMQLVETEQKAYEELVFQETMESRAVEEARSYAMLNASHILGLKWKRKQLRRLARERVEKENRALLIGLVEWKEAKKAGKPTKQYQEPYGKFQMQRLRKKYYRDLCVSFQEEHGDIAEAEVRARYQALRRRNEQEGYVMEILFGMIDTQVKEIAREYFVNSLHTAQRKMDDTNLYIVLRKTTDDGKEEYSTSIHYEVYRKLASIQSEKRSKLQKMLANWAHHTELAKIRAEERRLWEARWQERQLEEAELELMEAEDIALKKFYRQERQRMLRERWEMAAEDQAMRELMKQEALRAMRSKYDVIGMEPEEKSKKAMRRDEIKKMVADRQRAAREQKQMRIEDDLSNQMRVEYLRQLQEIMLKQEMAMFTNFDEEDDNDEAELAAEESALKRKMKRQQEMQMEKHRRKLEEEQREFSRRVNEAFLNSIKSEMEILKLEEQINKWSVRLDRNKLMARRADVFMKQKLDAKLKLQRQVAKEKKESEKARLAAQASLAAVDDARPKLRKAEREKVIVLKNTEFMNSDVMHDCNQRFRTEQLHKELHQFFFHLLSCQIANGAEIVSLERKLRGVMLELELTVKEIKYKSRDRKTLKAQYKRRSLLKLKRSELGKVLFGKAQTRVLKRVFAGWYTVSKRQATTRSAFQIKLGIAKHSTDLHKLQEVKEESPRVEQQTIMQRHTNRKVKCKMCKDMFMEAANNSQACAYHPGVYVVACPKTCTKQNENGSVDTACMTHYRRRWSCCDKSKPVAFGKDGCQKRWHLASDKDETYTNLCEQIKTISAEQKVRDDKLENLVTKWRGFAKSKRFSDLEKIRSALAEDRKIVEKYETLGLEKSTT
eukprot:CAMPEP_0203748760 /NCGR_PEP_ID=MMETSP0098-20131031/3562_1 /ASSEMBLY_ACC=CAM_ASM_000208 /TAXON_ID=96639 /ORGANISM=" , Strain NY0313808BC1" /LENGTH=2510 /DNA_ID=CAMNT_0050637627 /DNA_START=226 /DNA_END=7758 /DNA_ORIENTATION=-